MNDNIQKQIFNNLNQRSTEELVEIWENNNRYEWTDTAFNAIEEILKERHHQIPLQHEPVFEKGDDCSSDSEEINSYRPKFYQPKEVRLLCKWLDRVAIAAIIASLISNLDKLDRFHNIVLLYFWNKPEFNVIVWLITFVVFFFAVIFQSIVLFVSIRALSTILKILMSMEYSSREVSS